MHPILATITAAAAACTPNQGMGCFPCCGVTPANSGAVPQSGSAGLGAAALILVGVVLWKLLTKRG